jgi:tetratricopeptide (TPR) repeat protein
MPFVLNGVGTWYYGKRNVHRLRDVCSQCQAVTDLESYDTTLYFVVVFVPLIPLARKRIFDSCPSCNRHRVMPLGKWEAAKAKSIGEAALRLRESPGDREAVLNALRTAAGFQNVALAEEAGDVAAERFAGDAEVQSTLGDVSAYLARHDDAAAAYIASLDAADDPKVRDQLGLTMLRLGNVEAAAGCFEHVLTEADASRAWMLYQLAVAYQAKGMHGEALDLLDRADAAFPGLGDNKDWKKLRRASEKDRGRGRPVGRSTLLESKGAGVREGSRLGWLLPRLVLPLLLLGFAGR